jgi:hypothetical protein
MTPVKVTMALMSVRPAVRRRTSVRRVEVRAAPARPGPASGHRRKKGDLRAPARLAVDLTWVRSMAARTTSARAKPRGVLGPQALQPGHQLRHRADAGRHVDDLPALPVSRAPREVRGILTGMA